MLNQHAEVWKRLILVFGGNKYACINCICVVYTARIYKFQRNFTMSLVVIPIVISVVDKNIVFLS